MRIQRWNENDAKPWFETHFEACQVDCSEDIIFEGLIGGFPGSPLVLLMIIVRGNLLGVWSFLFDDTHVTNSTGLGNLHVPDSSDKATKCVTGQSFAARQSVQHLPHSCSSAPSPLFPLVLQLIPSLDSPPDLSLVSVPGFGCGPSDLNLSSS